TADPVVSGRGLHPRPGSSAFSLLGSCQATTKLLVFHRDTRTSKSSRRVIRTIFEQRGTPMSTATTSIGPLLQGFFVEHLLQHKHVSPQTVTSYRDTFRLLLQYV